MKRRILAILIITSITLTICLTGLVEATGDYQFWAKFGVAVSCFQIVSLPKSEAW